MADDPCYGFWDEYWNKEICSVISNANALGGEFENAAKDLRTLARATSDIYAESKLNAAADRLDKASKALKQPNKINEAFKAFNAIKAFHENYKKITPQLIENDPDAAADAFGRVLAAGGEAFDKMGPPFSIYSKYLTDAGELIDGVLHGLMPDKRKGAAWEMYRKAMNGELRGDKHLR
ncbi:hypothetical protein K1718_10700 [Roseibium porphyridii]|uniref:Uncharacterized protein n=1 Tax=Roseibium porphyridii TaxID=2866279 RepID=A0ABY8FGV9_9HYPH|nr:MULTISPECIES: hypothetical protein [Stappiaceae]QFT31193.1 hypothetical protein FIV00_11945 [Labrenzia sp. THAF82]WFE91803.1 hypothetical protein K1718_10700 [Roseibium sp. KMA01]